MCVFGFAENGKYKKVINKNLTQKQQELIKDYNKYTNHAQNVKKQNSLIARNAAINVRLFVRIDDDERHLDGGRRRRHQAALLRLSVAGHQTLEGHLLQNQFAQLLLLGLNALLARLILHFQIGALLLVGFVLKIDLLIEVSRSTNLCRIRGQSDPADLLLVFGYNVHGHQHVEGVVDTPADVLLIVVGRIDRLALRFLGAKLKTSECALAVTEEMCKRQSVCLLIYFTFSRLPLPPVHRLPHCMWSCPSP